MEAGQAGVVRESGSHMEETTAHLYVDGEILLRRKAMVKISRGKVSGMVSGRHKRRG